MGGADVIRQALEARIVDELRIIVAPVVLGDGKRLFDGFDASLDLEHIGVAAVAAGDLHRVPRQALIRRPRPWRAPRGRRSGR